MEASTKEAPKDLLFDADYLVYGIGFASEEDSEKIAKSRMTQTVEELVYVALKADNYELFLTGKDNYRNSIAKAAPYKGNRTAPKPKHYQALREHMVTRLGAVVVSGQEADDEVAIRMSQEPDKYLLVGVDKDLLQIPGYHFNPNKDLHRYITYDEGYKSFVTQMLTGDRVDNIPGLPGIGPAKAAKALTGAETPEELLKAAWVKYQQEGKDKEYFIEQGQLLWLRRERDELWLPSDSVFVK